MNFRRSSGQRPLQGALQKPAVRTVARFAAGIGLGVLVMSGCSTSDDPVSLPTRQVIDGFWMFQNKARAVTLAINDTYQMVLTPVGPTGQTVTGVTPTYRSVDSSVVSVDANGLITAKDITYGTYVIASVNVNGVTVVDTTNVAVTPTRVPIKSIAFDAYGSPVPTSLILNWAQSIQVRVIDSADADVYDVIAAVTADDPRIIQAYSYSITPKTLGKTKVRASVQAYGRSFTDSIEVSVGFPTTGDIYIFDGNPQTLVIGKGGIITFRTFLSTPPTIVFDKPDDIVGGDIGVLTGPVTRQFNKAGTYFYINTGNNRKGTIIVREQPQY